MTARLRGARSSRHRARGCCHPLVTGGLETARRRFVGLLKEGSSRCRCECTSKPRGLCVLVCGGRKGGACWVFIWFNERFEGLGFSGPRESV